MASYRSLSASVWAGRVQPSVPKVGPHQGVVLLFNEAVVVLVEGPAAAQLHVHDRLPPVAHQVVIQELAGNHGERKEDKDDVVVNVPQCLHDVTVAIPTGHVVACPDACPLAAIRRQDQRLVAPLGRHL